MRFVLSVLFFQVFCLFVVLPAQAGDTIENAVLTALLTHPGVEAAEASFDYAREETREAFSGYFPQISISGEAGRLYADNSTTRGFNTTRGAGYSGLGEGRISAQQMLFDGFKTDTQVRSARAKANSAFMSVLDTQERLAASAALAYIDLLRARQGLMMLKAHEKKVNDYLGRIQSMVEQGAADEAEYQQARDVRVILDGLINDYHGQMRNAEAMFYEATGYIPGEMTEPPSQQEKIVQDLDVALIQCKEDHPALLAAGYSVKSAEEDMDVAYAALYPNFSGELSYMKKDQRDLIGGEVEDARALVKMNWAIDTGGAQNARIRKGEEYYRSSEARRKEIERQIERGVRLAYAEHETASRAVENQIKRRLLNKTLFDTYTAQFEGARISVLQLMQADNQLFITGLDLMNNRYRVLSAEYNILAAMGRLRKSLHLDEKLDDHL